MFNFIHGQFSFVITDFLANLVVTNLKQRWQVTQCKNKSFTKLLPDSLFMQWPFLSLQSSARPEKPNLVKLYLSFLPFAYWACPCDQYWILWGSKAYTCSLMKFASASFLLFCCLMFQRLSFCRPCSSDHHSLMLTNVGHVLALSSHILSQTCMGSQTTRFQRHEFLI